MKRRVVLIHGAWLSAQSWETFEGFFKEKGHEVVVPEWPRKSGDVAELRKTAGNLAGLGIEEIADHLDGVVRALDAPPIIVGHSFGGLFAQILLDRGLGAAGVAIDPAPPKGILNLPARQLKAGAPALAHPSKRKGVVTLTLPQFTYGFVNTFTPEAAKEAYERYAVPETGRIFFQAASANFSAKAASKVNFKNGDRAPLLITAGENDNTVPASVSRSIYKKQKQSAARTDLVEFPGRPHFMMIGEGWEEVAGRIYAWLDEVGAVEA